MKRQIVVVLVLIFSCSIVWGECPNTQEGLMTRDKCIAKNFLQIDELQKEIQFLKDRIIEIESLQEAKELKVTVIEESRKDDDRYYFNGGSGHNCGGYIENGQINMYAVMCYQCDLDAINDIKRRNR